MTNVAPGHATATLSGRELALQRRQAMARHGKAGAVSTAQTVKHSPPAACQLNAAHLVGAHHGGAATAASAVASASAAFTQPVTSKSAARVRRQALSTVGKAGLKNAGQSAASRPTAHCARAVRLKLRCGLRLGCGCGGQCSCGGQCGCNRGAQRKEKRRRLKRCKSKLRRSRVQP